MCATGRGMGGRPLMSLDLSPVPFFRTPQGNDRSGWLSIGLRPTGRGAAPYALRRREESSTQEARRGVTSGLALKLSGVVGESIAGYHAQMKESVPQARR